MFRMNSSGIFLLKSTIASNPVHCVGAMKSGFSAQISVTVFRMISGFALTSSTSEITMGFCRIRFTPSIAHSRLNPLDAAEAGFQRFGSGVRIKVLVSEKQVCAAVAPPVVRSGLLRKPPGMLDVNH